MTVSAPEDRRFRRGRATPGQRHRRRLGRWVLAARVVLGACAAGATGLLLWRAGVLPSRLDVARVAVRGNAHLSTGEVLSLLDGLVGQPVLMVDLDEWRGRVLQSPWVADATLRRALPDGVEVTIVERQPLAIGRLGEQLVLVDALGTVIDEYGPRYRHFDLPIVDGLAQPLDRPGRALEGPRARLVARFLTDLAPDRELLAAVSQVDVKDAANVVVWLDGDHTRLMLGDREFRRRLQSYLELRAALRARAGEMEYVDLRFDARLFARPIAGPVPQQGHSPVPVVPARTPS
jgi:cell division protein FtsQ